MGNVYRAILLCLFWGAAVLSGSIDARAQTQSFTQTFAQSAPFDPETLRPTKTGRPILERQAQWLKRNPTVRIVAEGHWRQESTREYAFALSERLAAAGAAFLIEQGVDPARIKTLGRGRDARGPHAPPGPFVRLRLDE